MIFMSRKAISTARERIVGFETVKNDDEAAKRLRELMAGGNYLEEEFERESPDTRAIVLPSDARTVNGDRVVVLLIKDRYDASCEDVAVVCKPLRSVRKNPGPRHRLNERLGSMPKLPTLAEVKAAAAAPAPLPIQSDAAQSASAPAPVSPLPANGKRRSPSRSPTMGMSRGAALLRNELLKRGITVKAAAAEFGCSAWQITRWQTGQQIPDVLQAAALERVVGIPMSSWSQSI